MRHRKTRRIPAHTPELMELLESRLALYTSPLLADLPEIGDLSSPQNTVVRLATSAGMIDIELFDRQGPNGASAAPITTANFLNYISTGRYENTFFHRLVQNFVLQGGGFLFAPPSTAAAVETDPPIQNEFDPGRSNLERTIAMAKLPDQPHSATSQFFFNLSDNANLNTQNQGFTVFGRVVQGWEVVTTIAGFETRNLNQFFGNPNGPYTEVPVSGSSNSDVVTIIDAEVIKPGGQTEFFTTSVYYPEGYRAKQITSRVEIFNQDVNAPVHYQIIARFEVGVRDQVVASGSLVPGARESIVVSQGGNPSINRVRGYTPFAYEIRATGPIGATLEHRDFGATASESFLDPAMLRTDHLNSWTFANGFKGPGIPAFLVWESLSDQPATLTVRFFTEGGETRTVTKTLQPFRRGGLNLNDISGLPAGVFSAHIASTQPIVAALSQYRAAPGRGSTELGMFDEDATGGGSGASVGVLPAAMVPSDGQSLMSLVYTGTAPSVNVTISFIMADGEVINGGLHTLTSANRRRDFDLLLLSGDLPRDQFFTIRYQVSGDERVAAGYTSISAGDTMRTAFQSLSTSHVFFAGGFTDPDSGGREVLTLYNPFTEPTEVTYRLRFHFLDNPGDEVLTRSIQALSGRTDIDISTLNDVMGRINTGPEFRRYSITVEADITSNGQPAPGAIFAQLTRINMAGQTATYNPMLSHTQSPFAISSL